MVPRAAVPVLLPATVRAPVRVLSARELLVSVLSARELEAWVLALLPAMAPVSVTAAVRKFMAENPSHFDPRDFLKPAREAAKQICKARYQQFGCAGQGSRIQPRPLTDMARHYASGALAQRVDA